MDVIDAPELENASSVTDIKVCSNRVELLSKIGKPLDKGIWWQMQGYFAITGLGHGFVEYCLPDYDDETIEQQKELVLSKYSDKGKIKKLLKQVDEALRYSTMQPHERVYSIEVERDDEAIERIYDLVEYCRKWLKNYHEMHNNLLSKHV